MTSPRPLLPYTSACGILRLCRSHRRLLPACPRLKYNKCFVTLLMRATKFATMFGTATPSKCLWPSTTLPAAAPPSTTILLPLPPLLPCAVLRQCPPFCHFQPHLPPSQLIPKGSHHASLSSAVETDLAALWLTAEQLSRPLAAHSVPHPHCIAAA